MLSLVVASVMAGAQISPASKIIHATVFKNGYAFVTREVAVPKSGEIQIDRMPESNIGTLWFAATAGIQIKQITNGEVTHASAVPVAGSLDDLLRINVGKDVTLTLKDLPSASGILKSSQGDLVILSKGPVDRVVFRSQIIGLSSATPLDVTTPVSTTSRGIRVRVETAAPGKLFYVSLERGITWDTAYLVEMKDKKLALTSRATIVNDLEDLNGIEVQLSAFSPNLSSLGTLETLLSGESRSLRGGLGGGARLMGGTGLAGDSIDFISYDPTDNSLVVSGNEPSSFWAQATGLEGFKREDQFFYRQPDVRLKRGERAQFVLYRNETPYSDVYSLNISGGAGMNGAVASSVRENVSHNIKFTNQTGQPLSSATVSLMADGQLIGQSVMGYAPVGGEVEYALGAAPEIEAETSEEELNRSRLVRVKDKKSYDLVTLRGTVSLSNLSEKAVTLRANKLMLGEIVNASEKPKLRKLPNFQDINVATQATWNLELEPGAKMKITYQYKAYLAE